MDKLPSRPIALSIAIRSTVHKRNYLWTSCKHDLPFPWRKVTLRGEIVSPSSHSTFGVSTVSSLTLKLKVEKIHHYFLSVKHAHIFYCHDNICTHKLFSLPTYKCKALKQVFLPELCANCFFLSKHISERCRVVQPSSSMLVESSMKYCLLFFLFWFQAKMSWHVCAQHTNAHPGHYIHQSQSPLQPTPCSPPIILPKYTPSTIGDLTSTLSTIPHCSNPPPTHPPPPPCSTASLHLPPRKAHSRLTQCTVKPGR